MRRTNDLCYLLFCNKVPNINLMWKFNVMILLLCNNVLMITFLIYILSKILRPDVIYWNTTLTSIIHFYVFFFHLMQFSYNNKVIII